MDKDVKRETAISVYFWVMITGAVGWLLVGQPIAATVAFIGAGIVGVIEVITRDYFDKR